jgi:hypothetical protein
VNRKPARSGAVVEGVDWDRWSVVLCKPDAVERGLVDRVLARLSLPGVQVLGRTEVTVAPWQIHVHYSVRPANSASRRAGMSRSGNQSRSTSMSHIPDP